MFSFGWFSSGRDQVAIDLFTAVMDRLASGFIPGRLAYVFCDRAPGETEASDRVRAAVQAREGEAEPLFAKIRRVELRREFPLILLTLKNLAEGSFTLSRAGVRHAGRLLVRGMDLTGQVEEF